jgi:hypothetical protein
VTEPRILVDDEVALITITRNVAICGWRNAPRLEHVRMWHRAGKEIARAHPGVGACVDIVVRGTPLFTDDVRKAAEEMAGDRHVFDLGVVHAVLIPGFAGTAVRAFIGTVLLVSRPATPTKVMGDLGQAVTWLAPRIAKQGWTQTELLAACESVRAKVTV